MRAGTKNFKFNPPFYFLLLLLTFLLIGLQSQTTLALEENQSQIIIDGSILDSRLMKTVSEYGPLAEFTAMVCVEDRVGPDKLRILWSMDKTGGPNCTMNPPKTGVFTEMKGNSFSILLGGPGQTPFPKNLFVKNKTKLKIFLFVSVNEEDWRLIVPSGYKLNKNSIPTVSASINITYREHDNQKIALR